MAEKSQNSRTTTRKITNRKARHNFHILEVVECGVELDGTEVKSLRAGNATIDDAHARVINGEVFLVGANIAHYPQAAGVLQHDPTRNRKLLLRRRQIGELEAHVKQKGKTLVLLSIYFKRGWAKCELALTVGKKQYDKRQAIRKREQDRDVARELRRRKR